MIYILYNLKANNNNALEALAKLEKGMNNEVTKLNILDIIDYSKLFSEIHEEDEIFILGGDGTLNHFINDTKYLDLPCNVYFAPGGSGNDFFKDVKESDTTSSVLLNDYIKNLPIVTVKDKRYLFVNGVGYGIDGYCCEVADKQKGKSSKPVNYTAIAIKGILFHYKAPNAKVTVDGVTKKYKKVYLAPTMKGRYYGGGMMVAPNQNRLDPSNEVSCVVLYGVNRLKTLMRFQSIFKGEHIKYKDMVETLTGREIEVEFDRPTALQIDGETITGVTKYKVSSN